MCERVRFIELLCDRLSNLTGTAHDSIVNLFMAWHVVSLVSLDDKGSTKEALSNIPRRKPYTACTGKANIRVKLVCRIDHAWRSGDGETNLDDQGRSFFPKYFASPTP